VTRIAVVSSIYGSYDEPASPCEQDVPCEWVLVSDRDYDCHPWKVVVEPRPQLHPRLAAKVAKARPDWYADADVYIWVDGNVLITAPDFVSWCLACLGESPLAQHHNPDRRELLDEANIAAGMIKYVGLDVVGQARHYTDGGMPPTFGVWWTGLIVRTAGCPDFGTPWLAEQTRWTYEDQISQPYVLWRLGMRPADMPIDWPSKRHFELRSHQGGNL
jgi:hypothetical protein